MPPGAEVRCLMKKNVIILTSGLSGSSVLTGLIARAGYWMGDKTFKKEDYETFENRELIDLNLRLFQEAGYKGNYLLEFSPEAIQNIAAVFGKIDDMAFRTFLTKCSSHEPWIWKDPRLWLTIRFWNNLLDLETCTFILLTRGLMQSWISSILRRQITTYRYARSYETRIQESAVGFLDGNRIPYLHLTYEGLIEHPTETIERLNSYLDTSLTVEDLKAVYHKPLFKNPRSSWIRHIKAMMIYAKNYPERLDIAG
jgi:hypothetical protein